MSSIDNRIVQMEFDNQRFESNVKTSMSTLDKLKKALVFEEETESIEKLQRASDKFHLDHMAEAIDKIADKFTLMGQIGYRAIERIANKAIDAGQEIMKSLSGFDQMSAGWGKFEDETKAVQTMYSAVKAKGKSLNDVYAVLEKLGRYSDETSYSYSQMVDGMSKFVANGIELEDAEKAMEGISNVAAISGVDIQQAGIAYRNFADALASGHFKMKDWMSIENIHMDTEAFKNEIIATAKALGRLDEEGYVIDKHTRKRLSKEAVTIENFRDNLRYGFFDTEVMMGTLGKYADYDWDRVYSGEFQTLGDEAAAAAQNAKTFGEVMNAVKDSASTGWKTTFRLIFGNLEEAIALFTPMANHLIEVVQEIGDARNALLQGWRDAGGRDSIIAALKAIWETFLDVKQAVQDAGKFVFGAWSDNPLLNGNILADFSKKIQQAAEGIRDWLKAADPETGATRLQKLFYIFRGAFSVIDFIRQISDGIGTFFRQIFSQLLPTLDAILSFFSSIGNAIYSAVKRLKASGVITRMATKIADAFRPITSRLPKLVRGLQQAFQKTMNWIKNSPRIQAFWKAFNNALSSFIGFIPKALEGLISFGKEIWNTIKASDEWKWISTNFDKYIKPLGKKLLEFGATTMNLVSDFFTTDTSGEKGLWGKIKKRFGVFKKLGPWLKTQWEKLKTYFPGLQKVENWWNSSRFVNAIREFGKTLWKSFDQMFSLDTSNISSIWEKFKARIGAFWNELGPFLESKWNELTTRYPIVGKITDYLKERIDRFIAWWNTNDLAGRFKGLWEKVKTTFTDIVLHRGNGKTLLAAIGEWFRENLGGVGDTLRDIFGTLYEVLQPIVDWGIDIIHKIFSGSEKSESAETITDAIMEGPVGTVTTVSNTLVSSKFMEAMTALKGFLKKLNWDTVYKVVEAILKLALIFNKIRAVMKVANSFSDVGKQLSGMFKSWGSISKPVTNLIDSVTQSFKKQKKAGKVRSFLTGVLQVAISLMLFVSAIERLGKMDVKTAKDGLIRAGIILGAISLFILAVNKLGKQKEGEARSSLNFGTLFGILLVVWGMHRLLEKYSKMDWFVFADGLAKIMMVLALIGSFYVLADGVGGKVKGKNGGNVQLKFGALIAIVIAVWGLSKVIKSIASFTNTKEWWSAYAKMSAIMGVLALFMILADGLGSKWKKTKNDKVGKDIRLNVFTLLGIVAAVWLLSEVVNNINQMPNQDTWWGAYAKMAAIMGTLAAFILLMDVGGSNWKKVQSKENRKNKSALRFSTLIATVAAVWIMEKLIMKMLKDFPEQGQFERGFLRLFTILATLSGFMLVLTKIKLDGKHVLSVLFSLGTIVASVWLFFKGLDILRGYDTGEIILFTGVIAALTYLVKMLATTASTLGGKKMKTVGKSMLTLLVPLAAIGVLMNSTVWALKKTKGISKKQMLVFGALITVLSLVLESLAKTASDLGGKKMKTVGKSMLTLLVPLLSLGTLMFMFAQTANSVKDIRIDRMVAFTVSIALLSKVLQSLAKTASELGGGNRKMKTIGKSMLTLLAPLASIAALMFAFSETITSSKDLNPANMVTFAACIDALAYGVKKLAEVASELGGEDMSTIGKSMLTLVIPTAALGALMWVMSETVTKVKGMTWDEMAVFAGACDILAIGVGALAKFASGLADEDTGWAQVAKSSLALVVPTAAIGALMWVMSETVSKVKGVGLAEMAVFAGCCDVLALGVAALAWVSMKIVGEEVDWNKVGAAAVSMIVPALAIAGLMLAMGEAMKSMKDISSDQMIHFATSIAILAGALAVLSLIAVLLGEIGLEATAYGAVGLLAILAALGAGVALFVTLTGDAVGAFAARIAEVGSALEMFNDFTANVNFETLERAVSFLADTAVKFSGIVIQDYGKFDEFKQGLVNMGGAMAQFASNTREWQFQGESYKAMAEQLVELSHSFSDVEAVGDVSQTIANIGAALRLFRLNLQDENGNNIDFSGMTLPDGNQLNQMMTAMYQSLPDEAILSGISEFASEDKAMSLTDFSLALVNIGTAFKDFSDKMVGINFDNVELGVGALESISRLGNALPSKGTIIRLGDFEIEIRSQRETLSEFSTDVELLGGALKDFGDYLKDADADKISAGVTSLQNLASLQGSLSNIGGIVSWFVGQKDLSRFGIDLPILGKGLAGFVNELNAIEGENVTFDPAKVTAAAESLNGIAGAMAVLPKTGGIGSWFTGDEDGAKFASNLEKLGQGIGSFVDSFGGRNISRDVLNAVEMIKKLSTSAKNVKDAGGVSLENLGKDLVALGTKIGEFNNKANGITWADDSVLWKLENLANTYADISIRLKKLPKDGGMFNLQVLGDDIINFANDLKGFNLDEGKIDQVTNFLSKIFSLVGMEIGEVFAGDVSTGMENKLTLIQITARKLAIDASDEIKGKQNLFILAGKHSVDGFVKGIRDNINLAMAAASDMGAAAVQAMMMKLDAHSPSREFEKIGKYTVQGYALGIRKNAMQAQTATANMALLSMLTMMKTLGVHSPSTFAEWIGQQTGTGYVVGLLSTSGLVQGAANSLAKQTEVLSTFPRDGSISFMDWMDDMTKLKTKEDKLTESNNNLADSMNNVADAASGMPDSVGSYGGGGSSAAAPSSASATGTSMVGGIDYSADFTRMIDSLLGISDAIDKLLNRLTAWMTFDILGEAGADGVRGLANGLINGTPIALNAADSLANGVIDTFRDVFGWHSPWDTLIQAGKDGLEGLAKGLSSKEGIAEVKKSAGEAGNSALDTLKNVLVDKGKELIEDKLGVPVFGIGEKIGALVESDSIKKFLSGDLKGGAVSLATDLLNVDPAIANAVIGLFSGEGLSLDSLMSNPTVKGMLDQAGSGDFIPLLSGNADLASSFGGLVTTTQDTNTVLTGISKFIMDGFDKAVSTEEEFLNYLRENPMTSEYNGDEELWLDEMAKRFMAEHPYVSSEAISAVKESSGMSSASSSGGGGYGGGYGGGGGSRSSSALNTSGALANASYIGQIDYSADFERVIEEVQELNDRVEFLTEQAANLQIILDTGALVGSTAPMFDMSLGRRTSYAERGIQT